jgi:hypothetical protein
MTTCCSSRRSKPHRCTDHFGSLLCVVRLEIVEKKLATMGATGADTNTSVTEVAPATLFDLAGSASIVCGTDGADNMLVE